MNCIAHFLILYKSFNKRGDMMSDVYKLIEIVGTSTQSYEDAIQNAVAKASETIKAISWFQVVEQRGAVKDGKVSEYQVILKIGFKLVD